MPAPLRGAALRSHRLPRRRPPRFPTRSIAAVHSKPPLPRLGASSLSGCENDRVRDYSDAPGAAIRPASEPHEGHPALPRRGAYGRSRSLSAATPRCCSSSVVEHSLGKGEVESSILSCSTIFFNMLRLSIKLIGYRPEEKYRFRVARAERQTHPAPASRKPPPRVVMFKAYVLRTSDLLRASASPSAW